MQRPNFYPRPPRGGRPTTLVESLSRLYISIHALREEGDIGGHIPWQPQKNFYPRPPRGGRPGRREPSWRGLSDFYPRPPRGGRRAVHRSDHGQQPISIHALREEGDIHADHVLNQMQDFYPRPPRGGRRAQPILQRWNGNFYPRPPRGGRRQTFAACGRWRKFLSTPSARRATEDVIGVDGGRRISIHALREEGDL